MPGKAPPYALTKARFRFARLEEKAEFNFAGESAAFPKLPHLFPLIPPTRPPCWEALKEIQKNGVIAWISRTSPKKTFVIFLQFNFRERFRQGRTRVRAARVCDESAFPPAPEAADVM